MNIKPEQIPDEVVAAAERAAERANQLSSGGGMTQRYFIVWNDDKSEGFITNSERDAASSATGASSNGIFSTAGLSFYESYCDIRAGDLTIEEVEL